MTSVQSTPDRDATILKMVKNLNPNVTAKENHRDKLGSNTNTPENLAKRTRSSEDLPSTPVKRVKMENILDSSDANSPFELRRLRTDLLESRNHVLNLENRINHMHGIRKEMQIMFDNETRALKNQHEADRKSISELEIYVRKLKKREKELRDELNKAKADQETLKLANDRKTQGLEKKLADGLTQWKSNRLDEHLEMSKLKNQLMREENTNVILFAEMEVHEMVVEQLKSELMMKDAILNELDHKKNELQKLRLELKELAYVKENFAEYQEQSKKQSQKLAHYVELEKENKLLKEENNRIKDGIKNKLILEEEVFDLRKRLAKHKENEGKYVEGLTKLAQAEASLGEWRAVARSVCESIGPDASLPHLLRSVVEKLQSRELLLTEENVSLRSSLSQAEHEAKVSKDELEKIQQLLTDMKNSETNKQNLLKRMQKRISLVTRERDSYRLQLDSYERDLSVTQSSFAVSSLAANQIQNLKERIANSEKIVADYRELVSKLEDDVQRREPNEVLPPVKLEQLTRLEKEISRLRNDNDQLRARKDELEVRLENMLVGDDSLRDGQVFHLAKNPLSECLASREQIIENLEFEVDRLKKKIKSLEQGLEASNLNDVTLNSSEMKHLKKEVEKLEEKNQQLKEYFKKSMKEFCDVVYVLLGYQIDKTTTSIYRLRNMYSDNHDDYLCFQLSADGNLSLLETEYSSHLDQMIELYLKEQASIPLFLSSITIDLFNSKGGDSPITEIIDD